MLKYNARSDLKEEGIKRLTKVLAVNALKNLLKMSGASGQSNSGFSSVSINSNYARIGPV